MAHYHPPKFFFFILAELRSSLAPPVLHRHTALLPRRTATIYFESQTLTTATKYVVRLDPFAHNRMDLGGLSSEGSRGEPR
jgi:hypothetical protein